MPETLMPYAQASGAFDLLADSGPLVRLGDGDLYAYIKRMEIRTRMAAGQATYNQLPGVSFALSQISAPTYMLRCRSEYDHHDTAAMQRWGMNIDEAYRLGMRQATFQLMRNGLLYGYNPLNGEGLMNANGATAVALPPDSAGNTTITNYDNGQLAFFLVQQINNIKTRTNQLGIGRRFVIIGPQRDLGQMEYADIVQLTSYQRVGAGSQSTAGVIKDILRTNDDTLVWGYDDTLVGKGQGGNDAILVVMPEVEQPKGARINTNEFAKLTPSLEACTLMLCDKAAPTEIRAPLTAGAVDIVTEMRTTSGWGVRPESITIVSAQFV
jgi:hypothetical protein